MIDEGLENLSLHTLLEMSRFLFYFLLNYDQLSFISSLV